jgi:hypothetical protein
MRIAKTIAILIALVLVVICFNAPAIYSGEEHPWDGDGPGDGTDGATIDPANSDTTTVNPGSGDSDQNGSYYDPDDYGFSDLLFNVQYFLQFYSIPSSQSMSNGASSSTN